MNFEVVEATSADFPGIRRVQKITWLDTYPNPELGITKQDIESRFEEDLTTEGQKKLTERASRINTDPNFHTFVAKRAGEVVGFCMAKREQDHNRIQAIYVLPDYQGQGIGRELMEAGLSFFGNQNTVFVNVASYNQKAITFYKKFGFVETGKTVMDQVAALPSGKIIPEIELVKR